MITGISGATIWSEDLHNLLPFYRDVLGLKVMDESERFVALGGEGEAMLGLGSHSEVHGKASDPYRHFVGLNTSDLDADFQRLQSAGIEFIETPTDYGGLSIATFRDPEGNIIQLYQPSA
jgi:predicted enzyme related to lactoylglutathione lyase